MCWSSWWLQSSTNLASWTRTTSTARSPSSVSPPALPATSTGATANQSSATASCRWSRAVPPDRSASRAKNVPDPPLVQEVVDLAVESCDLMVAGLAALPGRLAGAEEPLALGESLRVLFPASVRPCGVLHGQLLVPSCRAVRNRLTGGRCRRCRGSRRGGKVAEPGCCGGPAASSSASAVRTWPAEQLVLTCSTGPWVDAQVQRATIRAIAGQVGSGQGIDSGVGWGEHSRLPCDWVRRCGRTDPGWTHSRPRALRAWGCAANGEGNSRRCWWSSATGS